MTTEQAMREIEQIARELSAKHGVKLEQITFNWVNRVNGVATLTYADFYARKCAKENDNDQ